MKKSWRSAFFSCSLPVLLAGCAATPPDTFVAEPAWWTTIHLRDDLVAKYDAAWQAVTDTVAVDWAIEMADKNSGTLTTEWKYTIESRGEPIYGHRLKLKLPPGEVRDKIMVQIEATATEDDVTRIGFDADFNRKALAVLQDRLGHK